MSVPGNNYMFPRGSPNILGIRRHLACNSLFLSQTLGIAFYFPLSSSVSILSASQQHRHSVSFVSLWFPLRWSHSFSLQPPHLPAHLIDQFLIFVFLIGQWYITKYKARLQRMITFFFFICLFWYEGSKKIYLDLKLDLDLKISVIVNYSISCVSFLSLKLCIVHSSHSNLISVFLCILLIFSIQLKSLLKRYKFYEVRREVSSM